MPVSLALMIAPFWTGPRRKSNSAHTRRVHHHSPRASACPGRNAHAGSVRSQSIRRRKGCDRGSAPVGGMQPRCGMGGADTILAASVGRVMRLDGSCPRVIALLLNCTCPPCLRFQPQPFASAAHRPECSLRLSVPRAAQREISSRSWQAAGTTVARGLPKRRAGPATLERPSAAIACRIRCRRSFDRIMGLALDVENEHNACAE